MNGYQAPISRSSICLIPLRLSCSSCQRSKYQCQTVRRVQFAAIPALNRQAILELAQGNYIHAKENAVFLAPTGTGKTHLAVSLGLAACRQGNRVRFATAAGLINELMEAQAQLRLSKLEAALLKLDLFILDEVGFVPFSKVGAELLFGLPGKPVHHQRG